MTLTDVLVGLLIGLIAVVVILGVFAGAEGLKRNAAGAAEAQHVGALVTYALALDLANAGSGLAAAAGDLATCPDTGDIRTSLRPIPVLITAGATAGSADSFVVNYAVASAAAAPLAFAADAPPGAAFRIRSALGFAVDDSVAAISRAGACAQTVVTAVSPPDPEGVVEVSHAALADMFPAASVLFNFGPGSRAHRVRYDVVDGTLRSLDLLTPGATPNPLASNVVLLKAQYAIDSDGDGFLDTWVAADAAPWHAAGVLAAAADMLARIKAVRIGIIVRSEVYDRGRTGGFNWVLFDCGETDTSRCTGRLAGTLPAGWRYRTFELAVPLRNQIWNVVP
jgi:type IV pilus assembly protein PilW